VVVSYGLMARSERLLALKASKNPSTRDSALTGYIATNAVFLDLVLRIIHEHL
jgi:hypothetical protein